MADQHMANWLTWRTDYGKPTVAKCLILAKLSKSPGEDEQNDKDQSN